MAVFHEILTSAWKVFVLVGLLSSAVRISCADEAVDRPKRALTSCPPDINKPVSGGVLTPLQLAADAGSFEDVQFLVTRCKPDLNVLGGLGSAAIHQAAFQGHASIVSYLIDHGADPNLPKRDGWSALHLAVDAVKNQNEVIKALLDHGATRDIQSKDTKAITPKDVATFKNRQDLVDLLDNYKPSVTHGMACLQDKMRTVSEEEVSAAMKGSKPFSTLLKLFRGMLRQCYLSEALYTSQDMF